MPSGLSCHSSCLSFLHFKGDVKAVCVFQGWVVVTDETTVLEEAKVPMAKDFFTLFLLLWDFDVLTRTHGKEKGKDGKLGNVG
jgi:hypothetical protein